MDRTFLVQALESIAQQTYPNIEVVVVSARESHRAMPNRCGLFPLRLVPTDQPVLRSAAANRAMKDARGQFLIFLDDDDWMMPDHIARLAGVLLRLTPATVAVYTGIGLVDGEGKPMGQVFDLPFDAIRQMSGNLMPIHAVLFRSAVLQQECWFDESLDRLEDWDFWLQLARLAPMVHLPGVSAVYRIHDSSGVHTDPGPSGAANGRIYQKWQSQWTPEQIGAIMQRVWTHPELEKQLANNQAQLADSQAQLIVAQQRLNDSQKKVAIQLDCLFTQSATMAHQAQTMAQLAQTMAQQQQRAEILIQELHKTQADSAITESQLTATLQSSSWRMTKPWRWMGTRIKTAARLTHFERLFRPTDALLTEAPKGVERRLQPPAVLTIKPPLTYSEWARKHDTPTENALLKMREAASKWARKPLISIVMPVYNPPLEFLNAAIASIKVQAYPHWEMCIADDASPDAAVWQLLQTLAAADKRIKVTRHALNGHISKASNSALALASGEFIALMDNDDVLPPDALYWIAEAVNRVPDVKLIYSDEDKLDSQEERFGAYFKPDWNYTLFLGHNLISHLGVYQTQLVRDVGGFRLGLEGSQDYDLALRCIERLEPGQILHIPKVLYHWRAIETSTALNIESKPYALHAAQRALQDHLVRISSTATVEILPSLNYHCNFSDASALERVSIILIGPEPASATEAARDWTHAATVHVKEVLRCTDEPKVINTTIAMAQGELVALLRSDLYPANLESLSELVGHALHKTTGVAAGTVRDQMGRLLSGGLVLNTSTIASVLHKHLPNGNHGYMGRGLLAQELSAVSLNCVVVRKDTIDKLGGFDLDLGVGTLGAVTWCLQLREAGYRVVWCPNAGWTATATGMATATDSTSAQRKIFMARYTKRSAAWLQQDPAYHPLLDPVSADFSLLQ
jgi:glycosyltransferase involved in cell wall biosynthesis